ncbi:MAG: GAF domain-containing protein [Myxacorys chilensis ATA2-1-KO14]|jgi:transcriptional regulator with GAF, ATPase, and Fis domain|nr:GAF domain-containing protein [Myxacorys chilensis ATA2-1-KO14]
MVQVNLKRVLKKSGATIGTLLNGLSAPVQIYDASGTLLAGQPNSAQTEKYPVLVGERQIGWTIGSGDSEIVATVLSALCDRELELKTLADEVLDQYREINLLYNLSEKLTASLDITIVCQTVLTEVHKLIPATDAAILLTDSATKDAGSIFSLNNVNHTAIKHFAATVLATAKGEIVNEVATDANNPSSSELQTIKAFITVPLKTEQGIIGVMNVIHCQTIHYTAQHFKLLSTVASQAAQAIANAQFYRQQVREAKAREEKLQQQLQELRLEVDVAKRSRQVAEITETEYFQQLQQRAGQLRRNRQ